MFRFLVVAFLVASAYGGAVPELNRHIGDISEERVVGGEEADIRDAPYQVATLRGSGGTFRQSCGGAIISPGVIATAAHCPSGTVASSWRVRAGSTQSSSGGQLLEVARFKSHENYVSSGFDYDFSLFFLSSNINIDGVTTRAVPLPSQDQAVADGAPAFITGWGSTREGGSTVENLRKVTTVIVNQQRCANAYGSTITPRMVCAGNFEQGGADACQGDSGGPLTVNGVLVGVTSFGRGCARPGYPGVWARVASFITWINANP